MLEELLIQITTSYSNSGMVAAREDMAAMQSSEGEMAAASVANMGVMTGATEEFNAKGMANVQGVGDQVALFNANSEAATLQLEEGFNPALDGMDTSHLEQLGMDMTTASGNTEVATSGVGKLTDSFSNLQGVGGMALMMLGGLMLGLASKTISAATTIQGSMSAMGGALGMSATQAIQSTPQLEQMALGWSAQTGIDPELLAKGVTAASLFPGMAGNPQLVEQSMPLIGGLGTVMGTDPASAAAMYGKVLSSATPSTMMTAKMGLNTAALDASAQSLGLGQTFASLDPTDRVKALNDALTKNGTISQVNAAYANSSAGKMAIFNAKLQDLEAQIGVDLIPALTWLMDNVLEPLAGAMQKFPILGDIVAGILLLGGALGLLAGPLMALGMLGPAITEVKAMTTALGLTGDAGVVNAAKVYLFGDAEAEAGSKGVIGAGGLAGAAIALAAVAAAAYVIYDAYKSFQTGQRVQKEDGGSVGAGITGGLEHFGSDLPFPYIMRKLGLVKGPTDKSEIGDWHQAQGVGAAISGIPGDIGSWFGNQQKQALHPSNYNDWGLKDLQSSFAKQQQVATQGQAKIDNAIKSGLAGLGGYIKGAWGNTEAYLSGVWKNIVSGAQNGWAQLVNAVKTELNNIGSAIMSIGGILYTDAVNLGHQIYSGLLAGLGIHSPGFMYHALQGEFSSMHDIMGSYNEILGEDGKNVGNSIINGFTKGASKNLPKPNLNPQTSKKEGQTKIGDTYHIDFYFDRNQSRADAQYIIDTVTKSLKGINDSKGR